MIQFKENAWTDGRTDGGPKSMQTALYGKIKERRREWLNGANTANVTYLLIVATQDKTRQRRIRRLLIRFKVRRRVLIIGKARINDG